MECDNYNKCHNQATMIVGGGVGWCDECIKEMGWQITEKTEDDEE